MKIHSFQPAFKSHLYSSDFNLGLRTAYNMTQNKKKVGFYQEGYKWPNFNIVSDLSLDIAIENKQPHLVIMQRFNTDESMRTLYGCNDFSAP